MIVRFDTPELAEKRFKELEEKHDGNTLNSKFFCVYLRDIDKNNTAHSITVYYNLSDNTIDVTCHADLIVNLSTAMKIVELMQEV